MSALKTLQDKIRHLELERNQAETNLDSLTRETNRARRVSRDVSPVAHVTIDDRPSYRDYDATYAPAYHEDDIDTENRGKTKVICCYRMYSCKCLM